MLEPSVARPEFDPQLAVFVGGRPAKSTWFALPDKPCWKLGMSVETAGNDVRNASIAVRISLIEPRLLMNLIVFEDAGAETLFPITTGRPCYAITCASYQLVDLLKRLDCHAIGIVRSYLEDVQRNDFPWFESSLDRSREWTLVVNARLAPTVSNLDALRRLQAESISGSEKRAVVARQGWAIAAAVVPTRLISESGSSDEIIRSVEDFCNGAVEPVVMSKISFSLFEYPHEVIRENLTHFSDNLADRIGAGEYREIQPDVFCGDEVSISDYVVLDTKAGPIVIEGGASIGPFTLLEGPVYVGPKCRIIEHAAIKDCVSLTELMNL